MTIRELAEEAEMVVQPREDLYEREDVLEAIEAAIRSAGEPLAAALHMLLRGYEPDRDKEEQIKERLWTAAAALAAWEAK